MAGVRLIDTGWGDAHFLEVRTEPRKWSAHKRHSPEK